MGKGACYQAWQSEFDPQDPHSGRREPTHASCPLSSTCALWLVHTQTHKYNKCNKKFKKKNVNILAYRTVCHRDSVCHCTYTEHALICSKWPDISCLLKRFYDSSKLRMPQPKPKSQWRRSRENLKQDFDNTTLRINTFEAQSLSDEILSGF